MKMKARIAVRIFLLMLVLFYGSIALGQDSTGFNYQKGKLLFTEDFKIGLQNWIIESPAELDPKIVAVNGVLSIKTVGGATVWLNKKLSGNYLIECKRKVIMDSCGRDRLSDLNMFWAASNPRSKNLFRQTGVLEEYDSLRLYYVGMGGNSNRTTRFRKYEGNGQRTLLQEYVDSDHLLKPNHEYLVQVVVYNNTTSVFIDGKRYFFFTDPDALQGGYYGIRTTKSHHEINDVKIYELK